MACHIPKVLRFSIDINSFSLGTLLVWVYGVTVLYAIVSFCVMGFLDAGQSGD